MDSAEFAELIASITPGQCQSSLVECENVGAGTLEFVCRSCFGSWNNEYCEIHLDNARANFNFTCHCGGAGGEVFDVSYS